MKRLIFVTTLLLTACGQNYSDGSRIGVVTKLSNKGLMMKSWEGEMVIGGMRQTTDGEGRTSMVANIFEFNVDPSMVDKVKAAQKSGRPVELVYRQWFMRPWSIEHSYVIIDVREPQ